MFQIEMAQYKNQPSLYNKISQSYIVIIVALLILGAVSYSDLLFLEKRIQQGGAVTLFEEEILEMRREEKNLFLYQSEKSLTQIDYYAQELLSNLVFRPADSGGYPVV